MKPTETVIKVFKALKYALPVLFRFTVATFKDIKVVNESLTNKGMNI